MSVKGTNNLCKFWIEEIVKWEKYEIYSNKLNLKIASLNNYLNYSAVELLKLLLAVTVKYINISFFFF